MSDGWVKPKTKSRKSKKYIPPDWSENISKVVSSMSDSDFLAEVMAELTGRLGDGAIHLAILGLGRVTESRFSRHQAALAVCLKQKFDQIDKITCYDPGFEEDDTKIISNLLPDSVFTSFQPSPTEDVLVFAPHLPHEAIEELLAVRQGVNGRSCLIVNDLHEMALGSKSTISEYGPRLCELVESGLDKVNSLANSWSAEPGAFNSLCFIDF